MKNIIKYIFLFHLLMFCAWAYPSTYTLRGLSVSDGLSDLLVNAIYKDSLGFVWIGTGNSLERFDGSHIKHYPITGSNEKLKRVNVIAEMEDNQLWMGNGMGLWRCFMMEKGHSISVVRKGSFYTRKETWSKYYWIKMPFLLRML